MSNGDEHAFYRDVFATAIVVLQARAYYARVVAQNLGKLRVGFQDNFALGNALHQLVHHDFFRAEGVAAVD